MYTVMSVSDKHNEDRVSNGIERDRGVAAISDRFGRKDTSEKGLF